MASSAPGGREKLGGFEFWKEVLGSPRHILAPMVPAHSLWQNENKSCYEKLFK